MANIWEKIGLSTISPFFLNKKIRHGAKDLLLGTPEIRENVSTLRPEQEGLYNQLVQAGQQPGAGGAFGQSADYYRGLLGNNDQDFNAFAAPALRQYREQIVPETFEQFAGMGAGGTSSSGYRNALTQGATDLSERLAQLRAQLRQSAASGLQNIGQLGLGNYSQNMVTQPGSEGLLSSLAPAAGAIGGAAIGGPVGAQIGGGLGSWFGNRIGANRVGANTLPVSKNASPGIPQAGLSASLPRYIYGGNQ